MLEYLCCLAATAGSVTLGATIIAIVNHFAKDDKLGLGGIAALYALNILLFAVALVAVVEYFL